MARVVAQHFFDGGDFVRGVLGFLRVSCCSCSDWREVSLIGVS